MEGNRHIIFGFGEIKGAARWEGEESGKGEEESEK